MQSLFLDCNHQLEPVFRRVRRPGDPSVTVNTDPFTSEDVPRLLDGYEICIVDHSYLPTPTMTACTDLKHVVFLGTGARSYMDVEALADLGVTVHTIKGYGDTAVAEHTIALMFAAARDVATMDREIRGGTWKSLEGIQITGRTLGLIGLGGIGREVARIARGIGMEVLAWNRSPVADAPASMVPIDELLSRADVLSLHLTLNDETRGFLDADRFARIRPGTILVNTARGELVDEAAMLAALKDGRLRHAGLDVFHGEPLRPDHPLAGMANVTLTSHCAFRTPEASETLLRRALDITTSLIAAGPG